MENFNHSALTKAEPLSVYHHRNRYRSVFYPGNKEANVGRLNPSLDADHTKQVAPKQKKNKAWLQSRLGGTLYKTQSVTEMNETPPIPVLRWVG